MASAAITGPVPVVLTLICSALDEDDDDDDDEDEDDDDDDDELDVPPPPLLLPPPPPPPPHEARTRQRAPATGDTFNRRLAHSRICLSPDFISFICLMKLSDGRRSCKRLFLQARHNRLTFPLAWGTFL
jgi:hypothetical protein